MCHEQWALTVMKRLRFFCINRKNKPNVSVTLGGEKYTSSEPSERPWAIDSELKFDKHIRQKMSHALNK